MALIGEDFLVGDDLDAVLALLEEDILGESEEFVGEVENIVGELNEFTPHAGFHCDLCEKVCKSDYLNSLNFRATLIFALLFFAHLIFAHPKESQLRAGLIFAHL